MTDPVLFLATLNFAAVHLDLLRGTQNNHKTLIHKGETIRRINARLQSSTETVSNTTIGAVAMLAAMEVMLYLTHHLLIDGTEKANRDLPGCEWELQRSPNTYGRAG